jgi:hypothetical protein
MKWPGHRTPAIVVSAAFRDCIEFYENFAGI